MADATPVVAADAPPAPRPDGSPGRPDPPSTASPSSSALKGRGRKEGPWTRHFLRLDEHQSKTVFLSICRFCLAAHSDAPNLVPPPRKVPARRASQIPHLKRCTNIPPGQARADVDALLAVYGNLAVPYTAPGKEADGDGDADGCVPAPPARLPPATKAAKAPKTTKAAKARASRPTAAPTAATAATATATSTAAAAIVHAPPEAATKAEQPLAQTPAQEARNAVVRSPSGQYTASARASPQFPAVAAASMTQYPRPPLQAPQQRTHPLVLAHPQPSHVLNRSPPSPASQQVGQQVSLQAIRQFQALVADVAFENGIPPEWVETSTLKRLVRWLRPELVRALPTADAISGSLLSQAAAAGADANQSDMDALVKQGARVAVVLCVEASDRQGQHGHEALLRVLLASLSAFKCYDVRHARCDAQDDMVSRLLTEIHGVLDRISETNVPVGSVCIHAPDDYARLRETIAREYEQLVVLPCFAHSVNTLASAVFRTPLIRSTLLAVAETIDAIMSPPAVIEETARAIPWQLALFSTVSAAYGTPLELVRVEATRWTSAYEAVASLMRVRSALREFATSHFSVLKTHPVAHNAVTMLRDDAFWVACDALEVVLRPLAVAADQISSGDVTLAQVVATFTNMARSLLPAASASSLQHGRTAELYTQERSLLVEAEALWSRCGAQRVALLAFFLHPETRDRALELRETKLTSAARLVESALAYYRLFFGASEPTNKLRGDLMKWRSGTLAKDVRPEEFDNWLSFWEYVRECKIAVELARLAIFVLSAGVHTGTCEELWRSRSLGARAGRFTSLHQRADDSSALAKLKEFEVEVARLAIDRQRRAEWKAEAERSGGGSQIGESASSGRGVARAAELPRVMAQQAGVAANLAIDGARTVAASRPRTQDELRLLVESWSDYCKPTQDPAGSGNPSDCVGHAASPIDCEGTSLSELVATVSRSEASI